MPFVPLTDPRESPFDGENGIVNNTPIQLITAFCNKHRPEVVIHRPSGDYQCIINGQVMGVGVTFMGALWNARYNIEKQD